MTRLRPQQVASGTDRISVFTDLWNAHHQDLWRFCLRRCASPELAEEALNESFTVAWKRIDDMPDGAQARPWLFGVAHNYVRRSWRNESQRRSLDERLRSQAIKPTTHDPAAIAPSASEGVLRALSSLSDDDQELLRLAAWEELPHAEIAVILGCSVNAVAVRLHRARERLAAELSNNTQSPSSSHMPPGLGLVVGRTAIVELQLPETIELAVVASGGVITSLTITVVGDTPTGLVDAVVTMQLSELGQAQNITAPPTDAVDTVDPADVFAPDEFPDWIPEAERDQIRTEMAIMEDVSERRPRLCIEFRSPTEDPERRAALLEAQIDCFEAAGEQAMVDLLRSQQETIEMIEAAMESGDMSVLPPEHRPVSVVVRLDSADLKELFIRRPGLCQQYLRFGPVPTAEDLLIAKTAMAQCLTDAGELEVAQIILDMYPTDVESEVLLWNELECPMTWTAEDTRENAEAAYEAQQQCLADAAAVGN